MNNSLIYRKWREYLWCYAPLILWIIVIFAASTNTGSMSNTSRLIRPLFLWLVPNISEASLLIVHGYTRKLAHFVFYFILGLFAVRAFYSSFKNYGRSFWLAAALSFSIAAMDETNQSFLVSRTGSLSDVLLDTAGGLVGLTAWFIFLNLRKPAV